jgi:hypothetical protein
MIVRKTTTNTSAFGIYTTEYVNEKETREDTTINLDTERNTFVDSGNKSQLKQKTADLLVGYLTILNEEKSLIDINTETIKDRIFKLREKEKNIVTDRLKSMTDEERDADTILKITKQGMYRKGLQKGLTVYDKENYEEEEDFRNEMEKAERVIRRKNNNITNENAEQYLEDYLDEQRRGEEEEREAYGLEYLNEDFYEGNFAGYDAPDEEQDDYDDYDS